MVDKAFLLFLVSYLNFRCHNKAQQAHLKTKKTYTIV